MDSVDSAVVLWCQQSIQLVRANRSNDFENARDLGDLAYRVGSRDGVSLN